MTDLLDNPQVKQTLTQTDEKYWYPFAYKVERHTCTCHSCGRVENSTLTYKVFAHYLYTPHTTAHKIVPIGGYSLDPLLPVHVVQINSSQPICAECYKNDALHFSSDTDWRAFLKSEGERKTAEARRDNSLREIFGGPPRRAPEKPAGPKVSLADFLKGM